MPVLRRVRHDRAGLVRRLVRPVVLAAMLGIAGCGKASHTGAPGGESAASASPKSAQDLYEAKRYSEAKALALKDAEQATGHDKEVALLTAGLSAHAQGKYDEAVTILTPLTRSEDARIQGRAKSAIDYIGIERGRRAGAGTPQATAKANAAGYREFTLQAGVFTSLGNAQKRANQLRPQAAQNGLGVPRIMPDSVNGTNAYAVQIGYFPSRAAANKAKDQFGSQVVVMPAD